MGKLIAILALLTASIVAQAKDGQYPASTLIECVEDKPIPLTDVTVIYRTPDNPFTLKDESKEETYNASAFAYKSGYFITAAHVIQPQPTEVFVRGADGEEVEAEIITYDPVNDMALLKADTEGFEFLDMYLGPYDNSVTVWTVGYPGGFEAASYRGSILGVMGGMLTTGSAVFPGMSGGPVVVCSEGEPMIAGVISTFEYRKYADDIMLNTGISNSASGQMVAWFADFGIALSERRAGEE